MNPIIKTKISPPISSTQINTPVKVPQPGFVGMLEQALNEEVKFSKHALLRIEKRELNPNDAQLKRLNEGVLLAKDKGSQNTLVLVDDLAFVVSVKNNTVVTALSGKETSSKVFTQIDSTVIN